MIYIYFLRKYSFILKVAIRQEDYGYTHTKVENTEITYRQRVKNDV